MGIDGADDDELISDLIDRAQEFIEDYTQTVFESSSQTTRYYTVGEDTSGGTLYLGTDLAALNTVKTNADATTPTTLTEDTDFITLPRNETPIREIRLLGNSAYTWTYASNPEMGIEVNGNWAYSTTPPNPIVQATVRLASYYYRQKDSQVFDVTAIPEAGVIQVPVGVPADVLKILDKGDFNRRSYV
jgi:hypothetical protein